MHYRNLELRLDEENEYIDIVRGSNPKIAIAIIQFVLKLLVRDDKKVELRF